jgi:hypothetical protein
MEWGISCSENNKNKGENPKGIVKKMDVGEVHVLSKMGWGWGGEWVGFVTVCAWSNEKSSNSTRWPIKNVQSSLRSAGIFSRGWQP